MHEVDLLDGSNRHNLSTPAAAPPNSRYFAMTPSLLKRQRAGDGANGPRAHLSLIVNQTA
jgi:hypothetical protein